MATAGAAAVAEKHTIGLSARSLVELIGRAKVAEAEIRQRVSS